MENIERNLRNEVAFSSIYEKGKQLCLDGSILFSENNREPWGDIEIKGKVRGSSGKIYDTSVTLSPYSEDIMDYTCTCPMKRDLYSMCKHEVALALDYLVKTGDIVLETPAKGSSKAASGRKAPAETSYSIANLLRLNAYTLQEAAVRRRANDAMAEDGMRLDMEEPAELTCVISEGIDTRYNYRYNSNSRIWSLGLKISRGRASYVVKSVAELIDAWRSGSYFSYGKNLAFVHCRSAFSDHANELLDTLAPTIDAQQTMYAAILEKYAYSGMNYSGKSVPMTEDALAQILNLLIGRKVVLECEEPSERSYYSEKRKNTVTVTTGDPLLNVFITQDNYGDFKLDVQPGDIRFVGSDDGSTLFALDSNIITRVSPEYARDLGMFCRMLLPMRSSLTITAADMPGFAAMTLPALKTLTNLNAPDSLEGIVPPQAEIIFRIGVENGNIVCHPTVDYGKTTLYLFATATKDQPLRDVAAESIAQERVARYFPYGDIEMPDYSVNLVDDPYLQYRMQSSILREQAGDIIHPFFPQNDDERYYALFTEGLRELAECGTVLLSEQLRNVSVRPSPQVRVNAGVRNGLLDIELRSDDMEPAELVAYLASYKRKQRFVRLSNGDIVRLDGSMKALDNLGGGLDLEPEELVEGATGLPLNRTLFVDAVLKHAGGIQFDRNRAFKAIIRDFDTVADLDINAPKSLQGVLRPYQDEGFKWLSTLGKVGFGGILADDMGLGKTLQMIAYLLAQKENAEHAAGSEDTPDAPGPAIVVCPASLVYNWAAEVERFAPSLRAVPIVGSKPVRKRLVAEAEASDLLVTSYDLLKRDVDHYADRQFSCVILDEAQYIKNSSTQSAKAVRLLNARSRFALTGTPIENHLGELWSIFDFLMPGVLGTESSFSRRFSKPINDGDEDVARQLQNLVGPFILRRLKGDVLAELPDKNESIVLANMEGEQEKLYRANETRIAHMLSTQRPEEFAGMKLQVLAELTKLRQLCCDPHLLYENFKGTSAKLDTCMELVRQAVEGKHGILLFSQFTSMLDIISARLDKAGIAYFVLTGATSKEERMRLVARFQAGEAKVFLISLKAGGVGLNLTAADIVIHYDPWWNIAAQNQATDRAHRIGQTKDVSVFKLIAKGTIEERIVEMQERKQNLADTVLGGKAVETASLTRDDLLALLNA